MMLESIGFLKRKAASTMVGAASVYYAGFVFEDLSGNNET